MRRLLIAVTISLTLFSGIAFAQCEESRPIRELQERAFSLRDVPNLTVPQSHAKQAEMYDEALAKFPDNYYLLRLRMRTEGDRDKDIIWAKAQLDKHPDRWTYSLLYAEELEGKDTPEAIRLIEAVKTAHPEIPEAYLDLADAVSIGTFKDKARMQQAFDGYLKVCPAPENPDALFSLARNGTSDQIKRTAAATRERLEKEKDDPSLYKTWEALWPLEFKAHTPNEYEALKKQIDQDAARFEKTARHRDYALLSFLYSGYGEANDSQAKERIGDEIVKNYPDHADSIVEGRWQKEHPEPTSKDKAEKQAHDKARLAAFQELDKRWPGNSFRLFEEFLILKDLPETTAEQISSVSEKFLAAYHNHPDFFSLEPAHFEVAQAYLKFKIRIDQVPSLVDEGTRFTKERFGTPDDRFGEEGKGRMYGGMDNAKIEGARLLLDYYAATNQSEKAHDVDAALDKIRLSEDELKRSEGLKWSLAAAHARAAEVEGHKLDALLMYRNAWSMRGQPPSDGEEDTLKEDIGRVSKDLGGTSAALSLLLEKPRGTEATETEWKKPENPLPTSVSLTDMQGKTWKLADYQGKAVLVNIWATWCGPCRQEHPEFQKLYDKLKDRKDVTVVSFNVDDDPAQIEPYIKEHNYTFPVILGKDVVDDVVPNLSIPRNWFINSQGKLEWELIGFDPADIKWQEMVTTKLDEVLKESH